MLHTPTQGIDQRPSPGKRWWDATSSGKSIAQGHTVLLGYNRITTSANEPLYNAELERLSNKVPLGELEALAWMKSNYEEAKSGKRIQAAAACAWSGGFYYYIPYKLDPDPKVRWRTPTGEVFQVADTDSLKGVFRIAEVDWGRNPRSWENRPDFALPVTIP